MTESEYREKLEKERRKIETEGDYHEFIQSVINYKNHDYGTICIGIAQAMMATLNYINRSKCGGITGFQAGAVGWEMIRELLDVKTGKLLNYEHMLYPQYEDQFQKVIRRETWDWLKTEAWKKLKDNDGRVAPRVVEHWRSITNGQVPFGYEVKK